MAHGSKRSSAIATLGVLLFMALVSSRADAGVQMSRRYIGFSLPNRGGSAVSPTLCSGKPSTTPDVGGVCFPFNWNAVSSVQLTISDKSGGDVGGRWMVQDNQALWTVAEGSFCARSLKVSLPNPYHDTSGVLWLTFDPPVVFNKGSLKRDPCVQRGGGVATLGIVTAVFP